MRQLPNLEKDLYLGLDFGTGGCRALVLDGHGQRVAQAGVALPAPLKAGPAISQDPQLWWLALVAVLRTLAQTLDPTRIRRLAVDGTSATLLVCDAKGRPLAPALMYNDTRATAEASHLLAVVPPASAAHSSSGSLAKLLWLQSNTERSKIRHVLHQADWLSGRLTGRFGHSDYNNCLKLGYDADALAWPSWITELGIDTQWLPQVHAPGTTLGTVTTGAAHELGLCADVTVLAGTTDGVAAFLAAGACRPGEGVTSLGSTLVLKLLSEKPVTSAAHGVYSHRLGHLWLAGGASNSGGAALARFFTPAELDSLTPMLHPEMATGLDYYPLPGIGERFPENNPLRVPRLEPRPRDDAMFLQGLLEGIARIEAKGYALLEALGAPTLKTVYTTGAGAANPAWTRIRAQQLGVPLCAATSQQAAHGTALLAAGCIDFI